MPLNSAFGAVDNAFLALCSSSDVIHLADGGVWLMLAPDGADEPLVVVTPVTDVPSYTLAASSMVQDIVYLVRVTADGQQDYSRASDVADAIDTAVQFADLTIPGYTVLSVVRDGSGQRYTDSDGFWTVANYYRVRIYKGNT